MRLTLPVLAVDFGFGGRHRRLARVRIVVVDDFAGWRRTIVSLLLEDPRLEVVYEASDGLDGVEKCQQLQPDLVLLDVSLPDICGLEAARRIREVCPDSKIVFLTATPCRDVMREALKIGAVGYVGKANVLRDLMPAVRAAVGEEEYLRFTVLPNNQGNIPEE
jgi:DNA-binding NarL/FixJ family response regulator